MTDSQVQKTTITLDPGKAAIVLGTESEQITCQLFASPEINAVLEDDDADIPFTYFLASAILVRLEEDESFGQELAGWCDAQLQSEAEDVGSHTGTES